MTYVHTLHFWRVFSFWGGVHPPLYYCGLLIVVTSQTLRTVDGFAFDQPWRALGTYSGSDNTNRAKPATCYLIPD